MDTNSTTTASVDEIGEKLTRLKQDIREVVSLTRSLAMDRVGSWADTAKERGRAAQERVSTTIKDHPMSSALIAAGVGALIGFLVSRR